MADLKLNKNAKIRKNIKIKKIRHLWWRCRKRRSWFMKNMGHHRLAGVLVHWFSFLFCLHYGRLFKNIPAYVTSIKDAYMPLVNQIMATDGYQKIMEGIGKASPIMINPETYDYSKANTLVDVLYKFRPGTGIHLQINFRIWQFNWFYKKQFNHIVIHFIGINY